MRSRSSTMLPLAIAIAGFALGVILLALSATRLLGVLVLTITTLAIVAVVARGRSTTTIAPPRTTTLPELPRAPVTPPSPTPVIVAAPPAQVVTPPVAIAPAAPSAPTILPTPGPLFIGREQELEELVAALRRARGTMAIAVVGPAGVGKSTLITRAVEAHQSDSTFTEGYSWHVGTDYHGDTGMRRLLIEVLDRFGGPAVAMTSTLRMGEAAVADLVRGKRILFWLDDVPEDFPIGRAISALTARDEAGMGPTLIVSSRNDWAIPEVQEIALEIPAPDEAFDLMREWMEFCGRGLEFEEHEAVKAIAVNLSSLPIALRLAAGYAAQSGAKLPKLAADLGSAVYPPGDLSRTADRTIAFVEETLFPQPRRAFAALAAFEGAIIDLADACAVAAAVSGGTIDSTRDAIESMVILGLAEGAGDETRPQIRLHALIKRYAQARLADLGTDAANATQAALATVMRARRVTPDVDDDAFPQPDRPLTSPYA